MTGWSFHHQQSSFSKPLQFLLRLHNRKVRNKKLCDLNPMHNSDVIAEIVFWHNILQGTPPSPNNVNWSQFSYSYARLVLLWQNKEGLLVLISSIKCRCCVSWLNWQSAMRHGRCRQFQFCKRLWSPQPKGKSTNSLCIWKRQSIHHVEIRGYFWIVRAELKTSQLEENI